LVLLGIAAANGTSHLLSALLGATVAFASFFVLSHLRLFGMGDAKLMACVGAALGWPLAFAALAYTLLAGAVVAIGYGAARGQLQGALKNLTRPERLKTRLAPNTQLHRMPYAFAILIGMIYALLTHYAAFPGLRGTASNERTMQGPRALGTHVAEPCLLAYADAKVDGSLVAAREREVRDPARAVADGARMGPRLQRVSSG
jgi:Flp pilus assembly protein protease CpaA